MVYTRCPEYRNFGKTRDCTGIFLYTGNISELCNSFVSKQTNFEMGNRDFVLDANGSLDITAKTISGVRFS